MSFVVNTFLMRILKRIILTYIYSSRPRILKGEFIAFLKTKLERTGKSDLFIF